MKARQGKARQGKAGQGRARYVLKRPSVVLENPSERWLDGVLHGYDENGDGGDYFFAAPAAATSSRSGLNAVHLWPTP